ncbi:cytochrome P450 alkane hydroxylase-like protein [Mollisia scopiformis]|uniref:Cytochrome P450 alkane hydroxylase-like protein n=1 Tax=Mollisia scopiformis TaxID=149040 RepID=A0A194XCX9_MOLSC|nr:cytochrome P450 alkane hydroxylase-like protein [Mollisia scopiformis]KUJ18014.1 cytochrome P450 alkane hydroxylase-like protein [Mollisia scopiformis]
MQNLIFLGIAFAGLFGIRYAFKIFIARRAYVQAMHRNGCKPVRKWLRTDLLFGLDRIRRTKKAMKDGNLLEVTRQDFEACGKTFETCVMGVRTIYTMEWANIHTVQSVEFESWGVRPLRASIAAMMGNGITVSDGPTWSHARKTLRPIFQKSQFKDLEKMAFEKHLSRMLKRMPNNGSAVDLQKLFQRMFINVSLEYIFGETRFSELDDSSPDADQFVADYNNAVKTIAKMRGFGMNMPYDLSANKRALKKAVEKLQPYVDQQIAAALKKKKERMIDQQSQPNESYVFVEQLVYETEDQGFVRDQLLNIFFPARDASSAGASFIFFILTRHPDVWEKLRTEVLGHEKPMTSRYLSHVINECLRLLAPASRAIRTCIKDCVLPYGGGIDGLSPIYVSAGTNIDLHFGQLHKDKDIWGPDALEFRPERWENLDPKQMLITQYGYLLVRMAKLFQRIENRDEVLEFVEEHSMTITSRNGVKVALIPDSNS